MMTQSPAAFFLLLLSLLLLTLSSSATTSWVLPFGVQWLLTVSDQVGIEAREATLEEQDAIRQSTERWFATEIPTFYANDVALFQLQSLNCTIFDTTYDGAWWTTILMDCEVTFDTTSLDYLPTNEQFLLDMNLPVGGFRNDHLLMNDAVGMFQWVSKLGYITTNRGDWVSAAVLEEETLTNSTNTTGMASNGTTTAP